MGHLNVIKLFYAVLTNLEGVFTSLAKTKSGQKFLQLPHFGFKSKKLDLATADLAIDGSTVFGHHGATSRIIFGSSKYLSELYRELWFGPSLKIRSLITIL